MCTNPKTASLHVVKYFVCKIWIHEVVAIIVAVGRALRSLASVLVLSRPFFNVTGAILWYSVLSLAFVFRFRFSRDTNSYKVF